jgi:hypothetical protein
MHKAKNAHEHTGSAEAVRPSLRNGFTAYFVLSPVRPELVCHRRPQRRSSLLGNLTPAIGASGPHDFAVRFSHARQSQLSRPSLPDPRFVTNAHTPLWWDGMAQEVKLICLRDQARPLRHIGTTGKSVKCMSSSYLMARCTFPSRVVGTSSSQKRSDMRGSRVRRPRYRGACHRAALHADRL